MIKDWWREFWRVRRGDVAAMLVIVLFFALFFGPVIIEGRFFLWYDSYIESLPERVVAWEMIRQGQLPLWTPLMMCGYPLFSMAQVAIGYPLTWGYLFLPGHWAEEIYVLAPYLLAPAFTYAYACTIGRSRTASLLAALSYGYGGLMLIAYIHNGMLPNSTMWLPLVLIAVDRAQTKPFATSLLWTTSAYVMSVLSGIGQGFLLVGLLALSYALFLALTAPRPDGEKEIFGGIGFGWQRWRPLAVAVAALFTSAGIAAFQILETLRAQRRSIRSTLSYEIFSEGSFTLRMASKSLIAPFYNHGDIVTTYVPPVALLLAVVAVVCAFRDRRRDARIFFWLIVACVAWILILGINTPLYRVLFYVPVLKLFRGAARHAFEWTFAISMLAAYGWDFVVKRVSREEKSADGLPRRGIFQSLAALSLGLVVALLWWKAMKRVPGPTALIKSELSERGFLIWKLCFTSLVFLAIWLSLKLSARRVRMGVAACAIALACFIEPFMLVSGWWWPLAKPASRVTMPTAPTRFLQQFTPEQNRIYTHVHLDAEEYNPQPLFDSQNLTMLHGLQNVAGYEPLTLERYSRALGNVWLDGVTTRGGFTPDETLFKKQSHVLDLLNNSYVLMYANPLEVTENRKERDGIKFPIADEFFGLEPGQKVELVGMEAEGDTLAFITFLTYSAPLDQGTPVARLRVWTTDGEVIERELRAGVDSAEWAHERPDVRPNVRHTLAPIFDLAGDVVVEFPIYRFFSRVPLGKSVKVERVEISNIRNDSSVVFFKEVIYNSATSRSFALQREPTFDPQKWQPVYNKDNVLILRNTRVLPRAWLVAEAEAVDGEEALARIRGASEREFDPRRTALLEVARENLPELPGGAVLPASSARLVSYEPNRLVIETDADTPSVLVVSELNYPGWEATVDGKAAPMHTADFLLRGIVMPAGKHRVEMEYKAPAARNGAFISLFTLLGLVGLGVYERRSKKLTTL
ncbi:MAG: YfhO family protein [Pyrinomonadaceae bacterium]